MDKIYLQLFLPLIGFIAVAIVIRYIYQYFVSKYGQCDYEINQKPLTDNELEVFKRIKSVISAGLIVEPQVNYDKVLKVKSNSKHKQNSRNKINRRSLDYVIFRELDFSPILAIELDDITHQRLDRQEKDFFENDIFSKSGLPLLRIKLHETNNFDNLKIMINSKINDRVTIGI